jgi:hypothetical protein
MEKTKEVELNAKPIPIEQRWLPQHKLTNTACTRLMGLQLRCVRVFRHFARLLRFQQNGVISSRPPAGNANR